MAVFVEQYRLRKELGKGSFGVTYLGVHQDTGQFAAVKLERKDEEYPQLQWEYSINQQLQRNPGFARVYAYGTSGKYRYMILEYLGVNLEQLKTTRYKFDVKTCCLLMDQILDRFRVLHSIGYIHRDIKPENFMFIDGMVYLIDFGLAKKFIVGRDHIPYANNKSLTGTARYASVRNHLGREQSRRDDLEAIGYMLLYFFHGSLPWQNLEEEDRVRKYEHMLRTKQDSFYELFKGLDITFPEIIQYFSYVRKLKFEETPDYEYLKHLFAHRFSENGYYNKQFDF